MIEERLMNVLNECFFQTFKMNVFKKRNSNTFHKQALYLHVIKGDNNKLLFLLKIILTRL